MRRAIRSLIKTPGFSAAVVLTLAIALGANAALFALVNRIVLRPLPYAAPARLVAVGETRDARPGPASAPAFLAWQREARTLERLAAYRPWGFVLTGRGEPERLAGARVSADLFPLLGVAPIFGRVFTPDEDAVGQPRVALVSEGLWRRRLGSDRAAVGQSIVLNGVAHAVIGVIPAGFSLPEADVWVPLAIEPFALTQYGNRALTVVGRLRDGSTPAQASAEVDAIARRLPNGATAGWGGAAISWSDLLAGDTRPTLFIAWGAVALVLLIACANTASLMLARSSARRQEVAICRALGAPRWRLSARVLGESVALAIAGGLLGLPLAAGLLKVVVALAPPNLPRLDGIGIDVPVLLFTAGLSIATAILFGSFPALRGARADLTGDLRAGTRGAVGGAAHTTLRHLAVSCQVGLTVLVLVGAGLLVRSFARVLAIDPGFRADRVLTMTVSLPDAKYGDARRRVEFFKELLPRIGALPGVEAAGFVSHTPLASAPLVAEVAFAPGTRPGETVPAVLSVVGGDWLTVMRVPLVRGRAFTDRDAAGAPPVVIVNARLAARLWPNVDPIGRSIVIGGSLGADQAPREIVGVAGDVRSTLETGPADQVYLPQAQNPWPTMTLMVRTVGDPARWTDSVRAAVHGLDRDQAVYNVRPLQAVVGRALAARRFQAILLSLFAAIALVLAATGIYSVVAYSVRQRRQEIGVRLALGARRADVLTLAVGDSLRWAAAGLLLGGVLSFFAARALSGVLYEVAPTDLITFVGAAGVATIIVLLGSSAAARAALRVDPVVALRDG